MKRHVLDRHDFDYVCMTVLLSRQHQGVDIRDVLSRRLTIPEPMRSRAAAARRDIARELHGRGWSFVNIARALGRHITTVRTYLHPRRYTIEIR